MRSEITNDIHPTSDQKLKLNNGVIISTIIIIICEKLFFLSFYNLDEFSIFKKTMLWKLFIFPCAKGELVLKIDIFSFDVNQ